MRFYPIARKLINPRSALSSAVPVKRKTTIGISIRLFCPLLFHSFQPVFVFIQREIPMVFLRFTAQRYLMRCVIDQLFGR